EKVNQLKAEYQLIEAQLRNRAEAAAPPQAQPLTLAEIQQRVLDHDTLLLEYSLGAERSFLFVVSKDAMHVCELPPRESIEAAVGRLCTRLKGEGTPEEYWAA